MKTGEIVIHFRGELVKFSKFSSKNQCAKNINVDGKKQITIILLPENLPSAIRQVKLEALRKTPLFIKKNLMKAFIQGSDQFEECAVVQTSPDELKYVDSSLDYLIWEIHGNVVRLSDMRLSKRIFSNLKLGVGCRYFVEEWTGAHPLFKSPEQVAVFSSRDHAIAVFSNMMQHELLANEVHALLQKSYYKPSPYLKHPFIVVEGLDGTGKSTTVKNLARKLKAQILNTPPSSIEVFRKDFDELPEICRRAYYSFGNYLISLEVAEICKEKPVILDRYWHSSAAFAIATQSSCGLKEHLPVLKHSIYNFPNDLLKPSAVILLTASEQARNERLLRRNKKSSEERKMEEDPTFTNRIKVAYERLKEDNWITVNTDVSHSKSLNKILYELKKRNLIMD